jgi:hypothetical protein
VKFNLERDAVQELRFDCSFLTQAVDGKSPSTWPSGIVAESGASGAAAMERPRRSREL